MTTAATPEEPQLYVEFPPTFSDEVLDEFVRSMSFPSIANHCKNRVAPEG